MLNEQEWAMYVRDKLSSYVGRRSVNTRRVTAINKAHEFACDFALSKGVSLGRERGKVRDMCQRVCQYAVDRVDAEWGYSGEVPLPQEQRMTPRQEARAAERDGWRH